MVDLLCYLDTVLDILLTNFKMLTMDCDASTLYVALERKHRHEQKSLRFIVLDELHTYDGAQEPMWLI